MFALPKPDPRKRFTDVVCGSGGPTAALTGSGFFAGLQLCEVPLNFRTIGGASAGAINALMVAAGKTPAQQIAYLLAVNFSRLFVDRGKEGRRAAVTEWLLSEVRGDETVRIGLRDSTALGKAMELIAPKWPDNFWTIGSSGEKFYLFMPDGMYEFEPGQQRHLIHRGPIAISTALRVTTTIPLLMHPVTVNDRVMQDGCFTTYGRCPTGVVRDHLNGRPENTISCVPHAPRRLTDRLLIRFAQHLSGKHGQLNEPEGTVVEPVVTAVNSRVQFDLPRDVKEHAILAGARATVDKLHAEGVIDDVQHRRNVEACSTFAALSEAIGLTEEVMHEARRCEFAEDNIVLPANENRLATLGGEHAA